MRKITTLLCAVLLTMIGFAQGNENFENADLPGSYSDGTFIGESGLTFTYAESRNQADYPIDGEGLLLRRASDSYLEWTVPDGVGSISFEYRKAYTGGSIRQLELLVNGNQLATTPEFGEGSGEQTEIYTFTESVNLEGEVTLKIKNVGTTTGNRHSVIDNISWTAAPDDGGGNGSIVEVDCAQDFDGPSAVGVGFSGGNMVANDVRVEANGSFSIETITFEFIALGGEPSGFNLDIHEDDGSGGVGTSTGASFVFDSTNMTFVDTGEMFSTYPIYEVQLTFDTPEELINTSDEAEFYWLAIGSELSTTEDFTYWNSYQYPEGAETNPSWQFLVSEGVWAEYVDSNGSPIEGIMMVEGVCTLEDCSGQPMAGEIEGDAVRSVCSGDGFTLTVTGYTSGVVLNYQWQESDDQGDTWVDIEGATSPILTIAEGITEATAYRFTVECEASEMTDETDSVSFTINSPEECYCTPVYTTGCDGGDTITNVTLNGETESINNDSGCSEGGYGDYTNLTPADLAPGSTYTLSVTTDYSLPTYEQVRAWIDYNQDGSFSEEEEIANSAGNGLPGGTGTFEFTVPENASPGNLRMRVRMGYGSTNPTFDACDSASWGEAEDYTIEIIALDECSEAVAGTPEVSDMEVCANTAFTISVTGSTEPADGLERTWQSSPASADDWTAIDGANSEVLSVQEGIAEATDYRYVVTCTISEESDESDVIQVSVNPNATECYCIPEGTNDGRYIDNFSTTGGTQNISNLNSGFSEGGYGDYTDMILETEPGQEVNFEVDIVGGTAGFRIWIDWNNDGTFDPVEEVAYNSDGYGNSHSGLINIPEDAMPGTTRMRIVSHWLSTTGDVDPCETGFTYGEFEDYTFIIAEATDCEGTPDAGIATVDPEVGAVNSTYTVSATGYSTGNGLTYQWQSNTDDDEWVDEGSAEDSYESFVATAPAESDSVVEWRLKVTCTFSEESSYSEVATFTTTDAPLYCTPEGTNDGRYIDNFSTTGGTQNISNLNSGFSAGGYGDYTDMILESEPGQEVNFEVDIVGGTAGFRIWIDWNNDGTFDPVEEVAYNSDGYGSSHSGSINIPEDVMPGTTRMRIVSHWLSTTGDVDPCETGFTYGEFEDYTLTIIGEEEEGYCTPLLDCSEGDVITNVTFLEIDNTTECSPDGYGDYTDMVATVGPGNTYPISVTVGDGYGFESVSVWIDFNDDEVFDEDEFFYIGTGSNQTLTGNIAIAADVTDGSYRMRVRVAAVGEESATWDMSCDESQIFGETEDYTVTVDETLSIDDHKISDFKYYPNPMTDVLFISANESIESVSVYNLLGQQVLSNKHFNNGKVDANSLPTGTYIFRATFENGHVENFKVLKK